MSLAGIDLAVVGIYFVVIMGIGLWFGRGERNTHDFFLGARRQHWLVVGLSIVATEVSALTFISVPGVAFEGDWNYLQLYAGSFIGRVLIVLLLLPAFYGSNVTTVYEYLGRRFGPKTRTTASLMFFASRIVGSGIRLLVASLAMSIVFDWSLTWVILGAAAAAVVYATFGGIKAIIWTDAAQALVFLGGGIAALVFLFWAIPGSASSNLEAALDAGKLHTFTWDWDPNNERSFWVLLISMTLMNMAALGTDQDLTQRMLTCPDLRRGQRSLMFNAVVGLPVVCLFLLIGSMMFVHHNGAPGGVFPAGVVGEKDRVFPYFIATVLPGGWGLRGFLVAGIFAAAMSSLDSALGALSSTAVTDFYRPFIASRGNRAPEEIERRCLVVARWCSVAFGAVIVMVALAFAGQTGLLWEAFKWVGLISGGMLGVFLLGVLTKTKGNDTVNVIAMLSSVALLAALKYVQDSRGVIYVAWPWWIVFGTAWTFGVSACFKVRRSPTGGATSRRLAGV